MNSNKLRQPYTFDRVVRIIFTLCIVAAVLFLLNLLKGVLLPFIVSCLIAYMLEPLVQWNMRLFRTKKRLPAIMTTLVEVITVLTVICWLFIPYIIDECATMAELIKKYATSQFSVRFLPDDVMIFLKEYIDWHYIASLLDKQQWINVAQKMINSSWAIVSSSVSLILSISSWLIVILYVIFIMLDYDRIMYGFRRMVPARHSRNVFTIFDDVKNAMNMYFRGQTLIAFTVGVLFAIGFSIIGLPMGIMLGLFIGLLNMVPYLQIISFPITAILCLVCAADTGIDFWVIFIESIIVYIVVQIIQDFFLTPKIMGKAMGLNPAIILLSLSIWGSLMGIMGMIIALPVTTLLLSYYDKYIVQPSNKILDGKTIENHHHSSDDTIDSAPGDHFE